MAAAHPDHDRHVRLTNRSASLALLAALFFFVGLVTFGMTVQKTEDLAARAVSGAPLVAAVGSAMWARVSRSKLRALRDGVTATGATAGGDSGIRNSDGPPGPEQDRAGRSEAS